MVVNTLSVVIYTSLGVDNATMAFLTSWLYLPWVIKPLWSPIVDMYSTKRRWTLMMQLAMAVGFAAVALALAASGALWWSLGVFMLLAFFSATHDIAADGYYMIALTEHAQSQFVGIRTTFYRVATIFGQGGLVWIAGWAGREGAAPLQAWQIVMGLLSLLFFGLFAWHTVAMPRVGNWDLGVGNSPEEPKVGFWEVLVAFFRKRGVWTAILFILIYRLPEAQLIKLINPFLLDGHELGGMGLSLGDVGMAYGVYGVASLTIGGILGGLIAARWGLKRTIMPLAVCMSVTCGVFIYLSHALTAPYWAVCVCVAVEQLGYGLGTTAFTLYLIYFSRGPLRTSHYAICTGIMALGMMLPGMAAGWLQEQMGYQGFFYWTMGCCALTIIAAAMVRIPASFGKK